MVFLYSMFLFHFTIQKLSIISQIKYFNKHVLIDRFHFKHETRIKEKLLNQVYKKSQSCEIIILPCSVIIQLQNKGEECLSHHPSLIFSEPIQIEIRTRLCSMTGSTPCPQIVYHSHSHIL